MDKILHKCWSDGSAGEGPCCQAWVQILGPTWWKKRADCCRLSSACMPWQHVCPSQYINTWSIRNYMFISPSLSMAIDSDTPIFSILFLILCMFMLGVCRYECWMLTEARDGMSPAQNWSYKVLWAVRGGCWELNSGHVSSFPLAFLSKGGLITLPALWQNTREKPLKEGRKGLILLMDQRWYSPCCRLGDGTVAEVWSRWSQCIWVQKQSDECWWSASFLFFIPTRILVYLHGGWVFLPQ